MTMCKHLFKTTTKQTYFTWSFVEQSHITFSTIQIGNTSDFNCVRAHIHYDYDYWLLAERRDTNISCRVIEYTVYHASVTAELIQQLCFDFNSGVSMSIRNFLLSFIWFWCVEQWKCFWIIIIRKRIRIFGSRCECLFNYIIWLGCFCVYLRETYVLYCFWVVICFVECLHYWMWFRELCDLVILFSFLRFWLPMFHFN